jgi:catechol 2,3-dioxygenase-like lactoylglutathione lyase family enzyme
MLATTATAHIGLYVANAKAAAKWYVDTLGFKEIGSFMTASGHRAVFVRSDALDITYEVVQQPDGSDAAKEFATNPGRVDHVAFAVADVEKAFADAKKMGAEVIEGIVDLPEFWAKGYRYFMIKGAAGEKVEFGQIL